MIFHFSKIMTSTAKVCTQQLLKYVRRGPNFFTLFASLAALNTTIDGMSVVRFRFKRKELRLVCNVCPHCLRLLLLEYVYFCHKTLKEEIKRRLKRPRRSVQDYSTSGIRILSSRPGCAKLHVILRMKRRF